MIVLENLYNGNIEPTDSESLKNNVRYKPVLYASFGYAKEPEEPKNHEITIKRV